jgi:hypothetical protein
MLLGHQAYGHVEVVCGGLGERLEPSRNFEESQVPTHEVEVLVFVIRKHVKRKIRRHRSYLNVC